MKDGPHTHRHSHKTTHIHTHRHRHSHTHTHRHTHRHSLTHTQPDIYTHTATCTRMCAHTRMHACMHARTHTQHTCAGSDVSDPHPVVVVQCPTHTVRVVDNVVVGQCGSLGKPCGTLHTIYIYIYITQNEYTKSR